MLQLLLTVVPSICWVLYRCYRVFLVPSLALFQDLRLRIPQTPKICIDSVTNDTIVIHWDIERQKDEEILYNIVVNGVEVATVEQTSCKLDKLKQQNYYLIEVVAFNIFNQFKSVSEPVCVKTLGISRFSEASAIIETDIGLVKSEEQPEQHHKNKFKKSKNKSSYFISTALESPSLNSMVKTSVAKRRSERNTSDSKVIPPLTTELLDEIDSVEKLNEYWEKYQLDLSKLEEEYDSNRQIYKEQITELVKELEDSTKDLEAEAGLSIRKDSDVKDYEKKREHLLFSKSKLLNQVKAQESSKGIHESKLADLSHRHKKLEERKQQILKTGNNELERFNYKINKMKDSINFIKQTIEKSEENTKKLTAEKKELLSLYNTLKPLAEEFSSETSFSKDGFLLPRAEERLDQICNIMPEWRDEIKSEISKSLQFDNSWKIAYKHAIEQYVTMFNELEIIKSRLNAEYLPLTLNEYEASMEFGGLGNGLFKKLTKRNFSLQSHSSENQQNPIPKLDNKQTATYNPGNNRSYLENTNASGKGDMSLAYNMLTTANRSLSHLLLNIDSVHNFPGAVDDAQLKIHLASGSTMPSLKSGFDYPGDNRLGFPNADYINPSQAGPEQYAGSLCGIDRVQANVSSKDSFAELGSNFGSTRLSSSLAGVAPTVIEAASHGSVSNDHEFNGLQFGIPMVTETLKVEPEFMFPQRLIHTQQLPPSLDMPMFYEQQDRHQILEPHQLEGKASFDFQPGKGTPFLGSGLQDKHQQQLRRETFEVEQIPEKEEQRYHGHMRHSAKSLADSQSRSILDPPNKMPMQIDENTQTPNLLMDSQNIDFMDYQGKISLNSGLSLSQKLGTSNGHQALSPELAFREMPSLMGESTPENFYLYNRRTPASNVWSSSTLAGRSLPMGHRSKSASRNNTLTSGSQLMNITQANANSALIDNSSTVYSSEANSTSSRPAASFGASNTPIGDLNKDTLTQVGGIYGSLGTNATNMALITYSTDLMVQPVPVSNTVDSSSVDGASSPIISPSISAQGIQRQQDLLMEPFEIKRVGYNNPAAASSPPPIQQPLVNRGPVSLSPAVSSYDLTDPLNTLSLQGLKPFSNPQNASSQPSLHPFGGLWLDDSTYRRAVSGSSALPVSASSLWLTPNPPVGSHEHLFPEEPSKK